MRYEILTNMKTKIDKQAVEVLLYVQRCRDAIKKIPAPAGIEAYLTTKASVAKSTKAVVRAREIFELMAQQLKRADAAIDKASRKSKQR